MAHKIRYDFIGIDQAGDTVYGHYFSTSFDDAREHLAGEGVIDAVIAYGGWMPDDLVVSFESAQRMHTAYPDTWPEHVMRLNTLVLDILDEVC